ncbi:MAG: beta-class carbonic anhydrase, partial [Streptosporangiales bacterium]
MGGVEAFDDVLAANARYTAPNVPGRAARGLAVITCMDSRIDVLAMLGLQAGDAKVLRNVGARVTGDVLSALVLAVHVLGVNRVLVIAHTDCRMSKATDDELHAEMLARGLDTRSLDFHMIEDQAATLGRDVQKVRSSPYLPAELAVAGGLYV